MLQYSWADLSISNIYSDVGFFQFLVRPLSMLQFCRDLSARRQYASNDGDAVDWRSAKLANANANSFACSPIVMAVG